MDWTRLAGPLAGAGLDLLAAALGGPAGAIAATVGKAVVKELGVATPEQAIERIAHDPGAIERLRRLEDERADEWLALAKAGQEMATMLADRESRDGGFAYWWRPGGMYLTMYLWLQNALIAPLVHLPLVPWEHLIAFTALYAAFYMGGHTAKSLFGSRFAR